MWIFTVACAFVLYTVGNSTERADFETLARTFVEFFDYAWSVSPVPDIQHDLVDDWPGGLYTLLMSKHGCPRGRWNRGYISFTWRTPHVMLSHTHPHHCNSSITTSENNTHCHRLLSEQTWPTTHSYMIGPFSQYKMTLNFCQRMNNTETNHTFNKSTWPQSYFSLFDANNECPDGFHSFERLTVLPDVETWSANGFLPSFVVDTSQNERTILKLKECVREIFEETNPADVLMMPNSTFILLKREDYPCPSIQYYSNRSESISLDLLDGVTSDITYLFNLCLYLPESWNEYNQPWIDTRDPIESYTEKDLEFEELVGLQVKMQAYDLGPFVVLYGGIEDVQATRDDPHTYTMFCSEHTTCWTLIDLGRSFLIQAVFVIHVIPNGAIYNYTIQAGNDKWSLLRYGGVEIPSRTDVSQFVGRYIAVMIHGFSLTLQQFDIHILVADSGAMCMFDLGMTDGSITSNQISSSNHTSEDVDLVRAYQSGWCASSKDLNPYIQVDLLEETILNGITLYNWYNSQVNTTNGAHTALPAGARVFTLVHSSDGEWLNFNKTMIFHVDIFRPVDEPETFIFHEEIRTRYVRIFPLEPMTIGGQLCIRFELHGCRQNGSIYTPSFIYKESAQWYTTSYIIGATRMLMSPSQITSVGYPSPYEDGTSYTWLVDFRNVGFIKLIFEDISLRSYEDQSFHKSWYHCRDDFSIKRHESSTFWSFPTSVNHKNVILETDQTILVMEFTSCRVHTPRYKGRAQFKAIVEATDIRACTHLGVDLRRLDYVKSVKQCGFMFTTMLVSPMLLGNIPTTGVAETWNIEIRHFTIRLTITYFNIYCQSETYLEVRGQFMPAEQYTNCNQPNTVLFSESEQVSLLYEVDRIILDDSLAKEGFRIIYSAVEISHQQLLDSIGYTYVKYDEDGYSLGIPILVYKACSVTFMKCYTLYTGEPVSWQFANQDCWVRGKKLVTIRSAEEQFIMKYMHRTWKQDESTYHRVFLSNDVDPTYYSHIGISRMLIADGQWQFVGQDGSPISYSAWNTDEPTTYDNCVRMSFHQANKNNTWEVENCFTQMSSYYVCEEPVDSLPLQELESPVPIIYTGNMNTTRSGIPCQRWDSIPNLHEYYYTDDGHILQDENRLSSNFFHPSNFPGRNISASENYCRDPLYLGVLYCFTMEPDLFVEECPAVSGLDTWIASNYTGRLSITWNGYPCQRWDLQSPNSHSVNKSEYFPDNTISDAANYCRDPGKEGRLGCFTTNPNVRYDDCNLADTVFERCYTTHYSFRGTLDVTHSGLTCQRWDSTLPHVHQYADTDFPEGNKTNAENYCRDPSNEGYIWCYTTNPGVRWEACYVQVNSTTDVTAREMYTCSNGKKISKQKICNGIVDCADATDEHKCHFRAHWLLTRQSVTDKMGLLIHTQFVCGSKEIVSMLAHCDGIVDCIDGSDETNCFQDTGGTDCSNDEMQCGDGTCIHVSLACDFIPHCLDSTDEICDYPDCNYGEFMCLNGQCIPKEEKCNADKDCIDGSDERLCDSCSSDAFHCDLIKCIPGRLRCDNIPDCADMSDEKYCLEQTFYTCEDRWLNGLDMNGRYVLNDPRLRERAADNGMFSYYSWDIPVENVEVECNFDNVHEDGSISTVCLADLDVEPNWWNDIDPRLVMEKYVVHKNRSTEELILWMYDQNSEYHCYQTFKQICKFPVQAVAEAVDKNLENEYRHCRCVALTVIPYRPDTAFIHDCDNKTTILEDKLMYFTYFVADLFNIVILERKTPFNMDVEIKVGPVTCTNDVFVKAKSKVYDDKHNTTIGGKPCQRWDQQFPHAHNFTETEQFPDTSVERAENFCRDPSQSGYLWCFTTDPLVPWQNCSNDEYVTNAYRRFPCEEKDLTYPASIRCIYDTDDAGYMLGCRNGRHLQYCSDFECPYGMVKCPGSYCIPLHYVCDGITQCPGSEDEHRCGCNNNDLELILLVSAEDWLLPDNNLKLRQLAGLFNNKGTIVRIVSYNAHTDIDILPYEHKVLEMIDIEVNTKHMMDVEHECSYKILASDFIDRIRFTKITTRGVIFVQIGPESQSVARQIFQNISEPDYDVYRVIIRSMTKKTADEYKYVADITINSLDRLTSIGNKIFPSLCKESASTICEGNYKCSSSMICIETDKLCDGHVHCPFYDDEMFCGFVCPSMCLCSGYSANCTTATFDNSTAFISSMDKRLRVLDLSKNTQIGEFVNSEDDFTLKFPYLIKLNLSKCNIQLMRERYYESLPNLRSLDLSRNKISTIPRQAFYGLKNLIFLSLYGNLEFMTLESFAFVGLASLRHFEIIGSDIRAIAPSTFLGLKLDILQISHNNILQLSNDAFSGITVGTIFFESNKIVTFDNDLFNGISGLESLKTSAYKYCCIRPDYLPESACLPERDEFSSCDDLMRNSALQTLLWLMGISSLLGNILTIVYRIVYDRERLKLGYGIFVTNLAVADFFMGVYLLIIAVADSSYRKRYIFMDEYWRNSGWCTFAGVLSTVSSEASVLFVCLITIDRFLVIKYPLSRIRFTPISACVAASVAWLLSIIIAVTPLVAKQYFQNMFYTKSGVCVALPLTRDRQAGWLYAVVIFIGVNFITFVGIAFGQLSIYIEINNVSSKIKNKKSGKTNASRRKELTLARNLLLVVMTDFLCWVPIGCMGIMALSGSVISGEVYAWVVVFVLPVNSALNPVLYTLTVMLANKKQQEETRGKPVNKRVTLKAAKKRGFDRIAAFIMTPKEDNGLTLLSIEHVIQQKIEVTPTVLLNITAQLTNYLRLLHKNSMVIEKLDASVVFVTMENEKVTGNIKIFEPPIYSTSFERKTESMYTVGVIVSRLLECNRKHI